MSPELLNYWNSADTARNYTSNGLNQYSANTGTSFGYDTRGNLTGSGSSVYTYSSENLLLTGPGSASLSYDPLARLYQSGSTAVAASNYLYDGDTPIALYVASTGSIASRYVPGAGGELLVEYSSAGAKQYAVGDERGSLIAETDASGNSLGANTYDEYGIPGSGNSRRVQYTGQIWLPEIGMYYYKARIYSPTLGRFMQTDPIGYADGMNWYNYVGADPINLSDPTGQEEGTITVTGIRTCIDFGTCGSSQGILGSIIPKSILRLPGGGDQPDDIIVKATRRRPGSSVWGFVAPQGVPLYGCAGDYPAICQAEPQGYIVPCSVNLKEVGNAAKEGAEGGLLIKLGHALLGALIGTVAEPGGGTVTGAMLGYAREAAVGGAVGAAVNYANQCSGG